MKKFLKWTLIAVITLFAVGFIAFLYLIPPFDLLPREAFIEPLGKAVQASLQHIDDPAKRIIAERGRYLVAVLDCNGCHTPPGEEGPMWNKYLAGGMKFSSNFAGTAVSRNLTPDAETGLARRTDEQVLRVLRSGVFHDGRVIEPAFMPWGSLSNLTEEDRYAILRNIKLARHIIPEWTPESSDEGFTIYPYDYGVHEK